VSAEPVRLDRRHRRREETIEQILQVAIELMGEQGAAGLSLGEVARRMGIRTPSLYGYFDSKHALYDALFSRGWTQLAATLDALPNPPTTPTLVFEYAIAFAEAFTRWSVEHPAYSQLMHWRPIPGYEPAPNAYAPAVEALTRGREILCMLRDSGALRSDMDVDEALRLWTILISGVVTQQLANAPQEGFDGGTYTSGLPTLVSMFLHHFSPPPA
jgi:AcrR family transcriptional regulator